MKNRIFAILFAALIVLGGCHPTPPDVPSETEPSLPVNGTSAAETTSAPGTTGEEETEPVSEPDLTAYIDVPEVITAAGSEWKPECTIELPQISGTGNEAALVINRELEDLADALLDTYADSEEMWCDVRAWPTETERYLNITLVINEYPSYGTCGQLMSWVYDKEEGRRVELDEALSMAGIAMEDIAADIGDWCVENGYVMAEEALTSLSFRILEDGRPMFSAGAVTALEEHYPDVDAWSEFFTWTDGEVEWMGWEPFSPFEVTGSYSAGLLQCQLAEDGWMPITEEEAMDFLDDVGEVKKLLDNGRTMMCMAVIDEIDGHEYQAIHVGTEEDGTFITEAVYAVTWGTIYKQDPETEEWVEVEWWLDNVLYDIAAEESLAEYRELLAESDNIAAVAYLGTCEGTYDEVVTYLCLLDGMVESYPWLSEIPEERFLENEGMELYVILPVKTERMAVYSYGWDETVDSPARGELLFETTEGLPVILRGNISDIVPGFEVVFGDGEGEVTYSPCLSLENGLLQEASGIYDFSPYDLVLFGADHPSDGWGGTDEASPVAGEWYGSIMTEDGEELALYLYLSPDGIAHYSYGYGNSDVAEVFEGTWTPGDGENDIVFYMTGGPFNPFDESEVYDFLGTFEWMNYGNILTLSHKDGNVLIHGTEEQSINFLPFYYLDYTGEWLASAETDNGLMFSRLELFPNGEMLHTITDEEGNAAITNEGWWQIEEGMLLLEMSGGDEKRTGCYAITFEELNLLRLTHIEGEYLSYSMIENGTDVFGYIDPDAVG